MNQGQQPEQPRQPAPQQQSPQQQQPPPAPPPGQQQSPPQQPPPGQRQGQVLQRPGQQQPPQPVQQGPAQGASAPQPVAPAQQSPQQQQPGGQQQQDATTATTAEVVRPRALAVGVPGGGPPVGPPSSDSAASAPAETRSKREWRMRRQRGVPRLRIGYHAAPDEALDHIQLAGTSFGFPLGRSQSGAPVALSLFRPRPCSVCLLGGVWGARLLAFRALRLGARVVVSTVQPRGWAQLGRAATGRSDRMIVLGPTVSSEVVGSAGAPVLRLHDAPQPPADEQPAPWRTQLTVIRRLTPESMKLLGGADMVLAQRLTPDETAMAASALQVPKEVTEQLQRLGDDWMATMAGAERDLVALSVNNSERMRVGNPSRS